MIGFRVTVSGDEEIARKFGNTSARVAMMLREMEGEVTLIWAAVVPLTPVFRGLLRGSWQTEVTGGIPVEGVVGSTLIYAPVIERNRTPGAAPPPADAIASWVASKMGPDVDPFVVARSIGRKGIKGRRMLQRAQQNTLPLRLAMRDAMIRNLISGS